MDWGCGSGIAHRAFLDHFSTDAISGLRLWDRSALAMRFAERRASEKYTGLKVELGLLDSLNQPAPSPSQEANQIAVPHSTGAAPLLGGAGSGSPQTFTLLISHVLSELTPEQVEQLSDLAATATSVIWVEPGNYESSLTLIAVRERLRSRMQVVAPCTHQAQCGMLAPGNESHWCHHFASPPPEVFTDGNWAKFGDLAGVDLRSLPVSFIVLDRRSPVALPSGAVRVIGRPRLYKPHALLLGCNEEGVSERRLTKRNSPDAFKAMKRGHCDPLQIWHCNGEEIVETRSLWV